jgi:hypothetical protein
VRDLQLYMCDGALASWQRGSRGIRRNHVPSGIKLAYALDRNSHITSQKYEAILLGLCRIRALGAHRFIVKSDSPMIIGSVEKEFMGIGNGARTRNEASRHAYLYTGTNKQYNFLSISYIQIF